MASTLQHQSPPNNRRGDLFSPQITKSLVVTFLSGSFSDGVVKSPEAVLQQRAVAECRSNSLQRSSASGAVSGAGTSQAFCLLHRSWRLLSESAVALTLCSQKCWAGQPCRLQLGSRGHWLPGAQAATFLPTAAHSQCSRPYTLTHRCSHSLSAGLMNPLLCVLDARLVWLWKQVDELPATLLPSWIIIDAFF